MKIKFNIIVLFFIYLSYGQSKTSDFYVGIKYGNNFVNKGKTVFPRYDDLGNQSSYGAFVGYKFTENIGAEIGYNFYKGNLYLTVPPFFNATINREELVSMKLIKPTIVFTGSYKEVNPYSKLSLTIGQSPEITSVDLYRRPFGTGIENYLTEYSSNGGKPIGFNGVLGLDFKISNTMYLFGELDFFYMKYTPKNTIVEYTDELIYYDPNSDRSITTYLIGFYNAENKPSKNDDLYFKAQEAVRTRIITNMLFNLGLKAHF